MKALSFMYYFRLIVACTVFFICPNAYSQTSEEDEIKHALSLFELGDSLIKKGDYGSAEKYLLESSNILEKVVGKEHIDYVISLNNLGGLYINMGDYIQAEKYYLETNSILEIVSGKEHPDYATSLNNLGYLYNNLGDYAQAEEYYLEAKSIREKVLGKEHPDYVVSLSNLGDLYSLLSDYVQAEKYLLEGKNIMEKTLGTDHPDYAYLLNNLGTLYLNLSNYSQAEEYLLETKNTFGKAFGKRHPNYATSLNNLGSLYIQLGDYAQAENYLLEAKNIREKVLGKEHPDYALSLNNLAALYSDLSDYAQAEKYYLEAKNIREKVLGKEHPDYVQSLNNLGHLHVIMGDYKQAENNFFEAKYVLEIVFGKEHPDYALLLNNIGALHNKMGDYSQAEKYYLEAKNIREKMLGKEHPNYANSLNSLATLYSHLSDYVQTEKYLLEAKNIWEQVYGKEHPDYATSLNNLGSLYNQLGDYAQAEKYLLEAKNIREKVLGKEHPNYASSLNNLGFLYHDLGDYVQSEKYYIEAMNIWGKVLGKEHPDYALSLNNLATLYSGLSDYAQAEKYHLETKNIREKVLGKEHPTYVTSSANISVLYQNMKEYEKAALYIKETCALITELVNRNFTFLSEQQRNYYWNTNRSSFIISYNLSNLYPVSEVHALNYDNALFTKGLLLRTTNDIRNAIYSSGNPDLIEQYIKLRNIRQQIITLQTKTDEINPDYIQALEKEADDLDKELTASSVAYRDLKADLNLHWKDIRDNLSNNEVAIEFINYQLFDKEWTDTILYAALVLRSGMEAPVCVPLCEEKDLQAFLVKTKGILDNRRDADEQKTRILYTIYGNELYNLIWQPMEQYLQGIETIYYSPSGILNQIAFSAIPVDTARLIDKYDLHLVSSTREVMNRKKLKDSFLPVSQSVLYGGIQYDVANPQELQTAASPYKEIITPFVASRSLPDDLTRSGWEYLQGTESEVVGIDSILKKSNIPNITYMRIEANEESFKALSGNSPMLLHIATHGFFLDNEEKIFMQLMNNDNRVVSNPLLRSGLLFAGANRAWLNKDIIPDIEDGILTAEEIAHLDLSNTKLVVLSACETGLGEVQNSEGVFGLQRAFKLAGVETLIMSLWKVPDEATSKLMIDFYQNLLSGKSKQESFKKAQQTIREEYQNPYYWAGFVMMD